MYLNILKNVRFICVKISRKNFTKIKMKMIMKRSLFKASRKRNTQYRNSSTAAETGWNRFFQWETHLIKDFLTELEFLLAIYGLMYASNWADIPWIFHSTIDNSVLALSILNQLLWTSSKTILPIASDRYVSHWLYTRCNMNTLFVSRSTVRWRDQSNFSTISAINKAVTK